MVLVLSPREDPDRRNNDLPLKDRLLTPISAQEVRGNVQVIS
jgi:hypothetical protein